MWEDEEIVGGCGKMWVDAEGSQRVWERVRRFGEMWEGVCEDPAVSEKDVGDGVQLY